MTDLEVLASYLARRDVEELTVERLGGPADVLVLCGSAVLQSVPVAARAIQDGVASRVLVTGGIGHSTRWLADALRRHPDYRQVPTERRAEADILGDLLELHGVGAAAQTRETASTNCGENARFTVDVIEREGWQVRSLVLVQDPTMQRRTHASFGRCLGPGSPTTVTSFAPILPVLAEPGPDGAEPAVTDADGTPVWTRERFTSLALGEIRRLYDDEAGYGPRGADFIDHVDVPENVLAAYRRLSAGEPERVRAAGA